MFSIMPLQGSVRDQIHQAKPQGISLTKYTSEKTTPISERNCAVYGRQVLEALLFLHDKGLGHGKW